MEMRQEADVTSKLDHPCVVSFVGISIRPDLLMCLELAPLGSLRQVLDREIAGREPFNKYRDKDKVFLPVFSKEINFKLVNQVRDKLLKILITVTFLSSWILMIR
jgi:leucine-rich repeat kinase 1